jgi:hypothetical protein
MANEKRFSHLVVSLAYAILQGVIIFLVINNNTSNNTSLTGIGLFSIVLAPLSVVYIVLKTVFMRNKSQAG